MSSSKITQFNIKITRTTNYNTVTIETTHDYTGTSPKGFSDKEMNILIDQAMVRADRALDELKNRVAIPATVRQTK